VQVGVGERLRRGGDRAEIFAGTARLQARQILTPKMLRSLDRFFATYAGGYAVWLLCDLSIGSLPLILVDAAGLLCGLVTPAVTVRVRGSLLRPHSWGRCPERPPNTIDCAQGGPAPAPADAPSLGCRSRGEDDVLALPRRRSGARARWRTCP
jgi:hypothetical protein